MGNHLISYHHHHHHHYHQHQHRNQHHQFRKKIKNLEKLNEHNTLVWILKNKKTTTD